MKFLADMGISPRVVEELRQQGHDAVHLVEQRLNRMVDGDILQKAPPIPKNVQSYAPNWMA